MTKEEAKLVLDNARPQTKEIDRQFYDDEDLNTALDMAIKALEQQPNNMAYNQGLADARQILLRLLAIPSGEYAKMFNDEDCYYIQAILCRHSIPEIEKEVKAYEEKKKAEEEIKVGDIVIHNDEKIKGIVYKVEDGLVYGTNCYFNAFEWGINLCTKIGHMNEVEQLVAELKGVEQ